MTPRFTFGILTAVSSDQQAREDKASLEDQEKMSRNEGIRQGGVESTKPFVLDGYSRSGYYDLSSAINDIPPLGDALAAAAKGELDVLIVDNIDRLGSLAPMIATYFKQYKKQIHSVRQSGPIHDPATYDPSTDDAMNILIHVEGIIQNYRINKIRRGWTLGVPARIDRGLHSLTIPYGYTLGLEGEPAEQIPEEVALVRQMKEWVLAGLPSTEIARRSDKILPPRRGKRWNPGTLTRMLRNPYYAGIVTFGRKMNGQPVPRSQWRVGQGKHKPLWDESTHRLLVAELDRRGKLRKKFQVRYPFSGLIVCAVCGGRVGRHGSHRQHKYLSCSKSGKHFLMRYSQATALLSASIVDALQRVRSQSLEPTDTAALREQLREIQTRRARVQEGYESGLYNSSEASRKLNDMEDQAADLLRRIDQAENQDRSKQEWQERIGGAQGILEKIPDMIEKGDPVQVNQLLGSLIEKILVSRKEIQVIWWQ